MKTYQVTLHYVTNFYYKRIPYHMNHIKHFQSFAQKHKIFLIGGTEFPNDGATLLVSSPGKEIIDDLITSDAFYKNNLIENYNIEELRDLTETSIQDLVRKYQYTCK